jgi:hypothetical protein
MGAPFAGGLEHVLVVIVVVFDELLEQQAGIHKRFYELLSHRFLLSTMPPDYADWAVYSTSINGIFAA